MTDWMMEHWFIEAVGTIVVAGIFIKILCVLADIMDRD